MFDDAPQARVVLAEQPRRIGDRHCLGQRQHEGLKQQREARARASPRRDDLMDATLRTPHPRRARVQQRAMLEEIQMPPSLVFRVMDRAAPAPALRAGEPAPPRKIHVQIEPTVHRVERAARHHPRRRKTKGQLEKIGVLHPLRLNPIPPERSPTRPQIPTYPLLSARSPKSCTFTTDRRSNTGSMQFLTAHVMLCFATSLNSGFTTSISS